MISLLIICYYRQAAIPLNHFLNVLSALACEIYKLGFTLIRWEFDSNSSIYKRFIEGLKYLNNSLELIKLNSHEKNFNCNFFLQLRSYSIDNLLQLSYYKNNAMAPYILISMSGNFFFLIYTISFILMRKIYLIFKNFFIILYYM